MAITFDIEANNLLNDTTVDYLASPYKLKDNFEVHCIVVEVHETGELIAFYDGETYELDGRSYKEKSKMYDLTYTLEKYKPVEYTHKPLKEFKKFVQTYDIKKVIAHNGINYDHLVCKLTYGMDYTIEPDSWCGRDIEIVDTMVLSKTLNPDRFGGHSLDKISEQVGLRKIDFRPYVKDKQRKFEEFAADMLYYCIRDVVVNTKVFRYLEKERGDWDWDDAIKLEKKVADIITRQEHRGFAFDKQKAESNIADLDIKMPERQKTVEPVLPPRKATKKFLSEHTPPATQVKVEQVVAPKNQFKKSGDVNANMLKFIEKHGGKYLGGKKCKLFGKVYDLPIKQDVILYQERTISRYMVDFVEKHGGSFHNDNTEVELFGELHQLPLECVPLKDKMAATINDSAHIKGWLVEEFGWRPSEFKEKDLYERKIKNMKIKRTLTEFEAAVDKYVAETLESPLCKERLDILETTRARLKDRLLRTKEGMPCKVPTNPNFTKGQEKEICPNLERLSDKFPYAKDIVEYMTFKHRRNSILGGGLDWDEEDEAEKGYMANIRSDNRIATPAGTCDAATSRMKHRVVANIPRITSLYGEEMRSLFGTEDGYYQIGYDFDSLEAKIESHYCVPMDTRALTRRGWIGYEELKEGEDILGYNQQTGKKEWTKVVGKVKYSNSETYTIKMGRQKYRATKDHRWYVKQRRSRSNLYEEQVRTTEELNTATKVIINAPFNLEQDRESTSNNAIHQGKYNQDWVQKVLDMNHNERVAFLEGFLIADGYWHKHKQKPVWRWAQNDGEHFEAALLATYLTHHGNVTVADNDGKQKVKVVTMCRNSEVTGQKMEKTFYGVEDVWCPQTELGSWVMRQGDCITITGNCWKYDPTKEYWMSLTLEKPNDCHTKLAETISDLLGYEFPRGSAKGVKYGCSYNAQPKRVARTVGCDLSTGQIIFDTFWEQAFPLNQLKVLMQKYWETKGKKKFLLGLDGRKLPVRSKGNVINTAFQSAGVICAKRAMVIHDTLLKEEGLLVDFFKDDWKNKQYCQQIIAYHDEAQLEVNKEQVEFKIFKFDKNVNVMDKKDKKVYIKELKDKAQVFKDQELSCKGKIWSDIVVNEKCVFVAYNRAGELASKAVNMSGEYYNLNIELTAGYIVGRNWAECH
jgi:hypothetical protein